MTTATATSGALAEKGYNGKMLNVNLTTGEITVEYPDESLYRQYLGGYGIGARMLWDRVPKGADPLGPENMLGMFAGLLTGTPLFGQRWQVVCKSPLTGGWGDANCGGDFGGVLKLAGPDPVTAEIRPGAPVLSAEQWAAELVRLHRERRIDTMIFWPLGRRPLDQAAVFVAEVVPAVRAALAGG